LIINTVGAPNLGHSSGVNGGLRASGTGTIAVSASAITLRGHVIGNNTITFNNNVLLDIDSVRVSSNGGDIVFNGKINSSGANRALEVNAGSGDITFSDALGDTYALSGLTLVGSQITADTIRLYGTGSSQATLSIDNAAASTISGAISEAGNGALLSKTGAGTLTLAGNNTYSGTTTINAGTLNVAGTLSDSTTVAVAGSATYIVNTNDAIASLAGSGNTVLNANLTFGNANDATISGIISGAGSLTKEGNGTVTLSSNNTNTGATTINAGTLSVTGTLSDSTTLTVTGGATYIVNANDTIASLAGAGNTVLNANLTFGNAVDTTISGVISGTGSLTKEGGSAVTLAGNNTYTGTTTINAGTVALAANDVIANSSNVVINGGTLDLGTHSDTVAAVTVGVNGGTITSSTGVLTGSSYTFNNISPALISARLAGSGSLTQAGGGATTLSGLNSYSGGTFLSAGSVIVASDANLGNASGSITFNGGTLNSIASFTLSATRSISLLGNAIFNVNASTTLIYNGGITGSGPLTKTGLGTLILGGNNTYTGSTAINTGAITITGSLADTADVTVASGASYNANSADTINSILGSGTANLGANLTLSSNLDFEFGGAFTGSGSLRKTGSATLTLSGDSSFTGNLVLNNSRLIIASPNALGASSVDTTSGILEVADGIVLGSLRVSGPVRIASDIITTGLQTYNGAVTIAPNAGNVTQMTNYARVAYSAAGVTLSSTQNGAITFNSTIDAASAKSASLRIDAGTGTVTLGGSVGSSAPLQNLYVIGGTINLLADVLTAQEQTYKGATRIGNNGSEGFLYPEFVASTRPIDNFSPASRLFTRTLMSKDPTVRFEGSINPDSAGDYTLAIAAIYNGFVNGVVANEPRIIINGLVGDSSAFHSVNFQTLQAADLFMLVGEISTMGVNTVDMQTYSSNDLTVTLNLANNIATFRSTRPNYINFDLTMIGGEFNMSSDPGVVQVIIDGLTNFTGSGINLAPVGFPLQEAAAARAAAAAAANTGALDVTAQLRRQFEITRNKSDLASVQVSMEKPKTNTTDSEIPAQCAEGAEKTSECSVR
jgi:autotransporter-associated beta strand protein